MSGVNVEPYEGAGKVTIGQQVLLGPDGRAYDGIFQWAVDEQVDFLTAELEDLLHAGGDPRTFILNLFATMGHIQKCSN